MKRAISYLLLILTALLADSCVTYYTVGTKVNRDGSLTRSVYAEASTECLSGDYSKHPFLFKAQEGWDMEVMDSVWKSAFLGDEIVHNFYATRTFANADESSYIPENEHNMGLSYLNGKEKWEVRKGFFADRYHYECTFPGLGNMFPLPLEEFMGEKERKLFFRESSGDEYDCLNGMEYYFMLADVNGTYMKWQRHCIIEYIYDLIAAETGVSLTPEHKAKVVETVYEKMRKKNGDFDTEFDSAYIETIASAMSEVSGNHMYMRTYESRKKEWVNRYEDDLENKYMYPFMFAYRYTVEMPGEVTYSNAFMSECGSPVWKIDGFRLLAGDLTVTAESREVNTWSFILLGAVLIAGILCFIRLGKR